MAYKKSFVIPKLVQFVFESWRLRKLEGVSCGIESLVAEAMLYMVLRGKGFAKIWYTNSKISTYLKNKNLP